MQCSIRTTFVPGRNGRRLPERETNKAKGAERKAFSVSSVPAWFWTLLLSARLIPQERQLICSVIDELGNRHTGTVSCFQLVVQQDRPVTPGVGLHQRGHL